MTLEQIFPWEIPVIQLYQLKATNFTLCKLCRPPGPTFLILVFPSTVTVPSKGTFVSLQRCAKIFATITTVIPVFLRPEVRR